MGQGAKNVLERNGIRVVRGCSGSVEVLMQTYLRGFVFDNGQACDHHECGHH
jgi:predicted Fe-Mo cluster-binding NifX family protein